MAGVTESAIENKLRCSTGRLCLCLRLIFSPKWSTHLLNSNDFLPPKQTGVVVPAVLYRTNVEAVLLVVV